MAEPGNVVRVAIAVGHPRFREELAALLATEPGLRVVGIIADPEGVVELIGREVPDVLVLDVGLATAAGRSKTYLARLFDGRSDVNLLLLASSGDDLAVARAMRAGACGCLARDADPEELLQAVAQVATGAHLPSAWEASVFHFPRAQEMAFLVALACADEGTAAHASIAGSDAPMELVRDAVARHGGHALPAPSDAAAAVFADPVAGLEAALDLAERLALGSGDGPFGLALDFGRAEQRNDRFTSAVVSRAARLARAAQGRLLLSSAAAARSSSRVPSGWRLFDHGQRRLPGFGRAKQVFELLPAGMRTTWALPAVCPSATPVERISVDEQLEAGDPGEAAAAMRAALAGERTECVIRLSQARELRDRAPRTLDDYRLGRLAAGLVGMDRSDPQLVRLTLLVDRGEEQPSGRWQPQEECYDDLPALLDALPVPALVVLGEPGSGKTTLLRELELGVAVRGLLGESERVAFRLSLSSYRPEAGGRTMPEPATWLAERWSELGPRLPPLEALLAEGRVLLLLDALNEMPVRTQAERRRAVAAWRKLCQSIADGPAGNRVVISCRRLDYSQPLSGPKLRVPQVRIEPLADEQLQGYLEQRAPLWWREAWQQLVRDEALDVLRTAYYLLLFARQLESGGELPLGRAALSTAFVREAMRREAEHGSRLPNGLVEERDLVQLVGDRWASDCELPEAGDLIPAISRLAYRMQSRRSAGEALQVRLPLEEALAAVDHPAAEAVLWAGEALNLLDREGLGGAVGFGHQLLQEYFAARELGRTTGFEHAARAWRSGDLRPSLDQIVGELGVGDPLPPLPTTGWEETILLSAAMAADADAFLRRLATANLGLAGRCAVQADVRHRLGADLVADLAAKLADRSRDRDADLRERIECALVLGEIGDPRLARRVGPHGPYLMPQMVDVPGGTYPIGDDQPYVWAFGEASGHMPRHSVQLAGFRLGRFPVTNAEWALFIAAGGYDDERWWDTEAARRWRSGEGIGEERWLNALRWVQLFRKQPDLLETYHDEGLYGLDDVWYERFGQRLAMTEAELEAHLRAAYPSERRTAPLQWRTLGFDNPSLPVAGVSWYEARAYCAWLSAQTGRAFRLPTEAEWEAAARGTAGRRHAWGDAVAPLFANTSGARLGVPSPVGVFVEGDTPDGLSDMTGNLWEWTSSAWGVEDETAFPYPYRPDDGREEPEAAANVRRVQRGGAWHNTPADVHAAHRGSDTPDPMTPDCVGFRLAETV